MADDNSLRSYRSNDPHARSVSRAEGHDAAPGSDPLAELARLIGQGDPFADSARTASRSAGSSASEPILAGDEAPVGDWRRHIERPNYEAMPGAPASDAHFLSADSQSAYQDDPRSHDRYDPHDDYRDEPQRVTPADGYRGYHNDPSYAPSHSYDYAEQSQIDPLAVPMAPGAPGEEGYDDPPHYQVSPKARPRWLSTAVMLVGCALIGSTGAYGYRHYAKPALGSKIAPVIVADNAPSKIVPAATEQSKSSRSQDRLPGGSEHLVSREEQPVVLQPPASQDSPGRTELANAAAAAAIPPAAAAASPPPAPPAPVQAAPAPAPTASTPSHGTNAPKRIRTVTIRPDGGDKSARPAAPSARGGSRSGPQTTAAVPQSSRTSRDAPLSLDPSAQASEPAPPQQRSVAPPRRQASAPDAWSPAPRESRNGGPKLASAPSNAHGGGGYLVQVSSQRSESDARASYRGLQAKYSQLKSRQAIIRRADLGSKGTYYRAMVGPFGSAHDADQFCHGLKRSGGQCIILRN